MVASAVVDSVVVVVVASVAVVVVVVVVVIGCATVREGGFCWRQTEHSEGVGQESSGGEPRLHVLRERERERITGEGGRY